MKQANKNNLDENKFFGYNTSTVLITMTVTPKDIGKIVNANFETNELLGYRGKDIKGKNVRILMPKLLSDNHDSFIQNYFETARAKILEARRVVIAKDKSCLRLHCASPHFSKGNTKFEKKPYFCRLLKKSG